ncbi:unnamed protein product [Cuscuta europaea]|uniref:Ubiquitin-like protease family profile domain-containing protein n=2 Tax=Cuscuta europaea TaxID=41803 RepID=A0A9P1E7A5_CUSEU|nr:unnamed protein product [Cuscuta europaea]
MGLTQQPELHTEARRTRSPTHVSTKGSNAPEDISESDDELSRLYLDTPFHLVAMGKVHNLGPTIHHERIDSGIVRVEVVEVLDASALVPIPSEEVQTVGQAPNQFIQWPKRLVDPHVKEWTNGKDNDNHDEDNASDENKGPISRLLTMTTHLGPQPIELILKEEIVGRSAISLFVGSEEILEICVGNQMLSAVILQVWIMHLHGICVRKDTAHLYGFLDPHTTQDVGNKREDIQTYIMTRLSEGNKECYLLPYYYPNHWQLFVLCPRKNLIVFLCSLGNKPKANIKSTLDLAMQAHQMTKNKRNSKPKWIKPMSRMQRGSFECGYYVMRHITTIISASVVDSWMEIFNVQDPFSEQDINEIRERWALFFCEATSI